MTLRTRDYETAKTGSGAVGSSRQQLKIIGGSQNIGSPLSYLIGFRGQGLLHILLHSPRSDSTCTVYEMSGDGFGRGDGLHNY